MQIAPTPKDVVLRDGASQLYRFRASNAERAGAAPLLLVPSLINRWYVLDLREGASLAAAAVAAGFDTYCLDWGISGDEDRYLTWDDVVARLARMVRRVRRETGSDKVSLLGYCIGGTLGGIHAALHNDTVAALVNLAGPFDFSQGGLLRTLVDPGHFDVGSIVAAGNVGANQMQQGFTALRPTMQVGKWIGFLDRAHDPKARDSFEALETWAGDNIPFPAAAYETYIRELYQENALVQGKHYVASRRVDLSQITCPVLSVATDRDVICPPAAAKALLDGVSSKERELLTVPGGHVGAVVGGKAPTVLYPKMLSWLRKHTAKA